MPITVVRLMNGFAALGCMIAYVNRDAEMKMSRLAAIELRSRGYGQPDAYYLTLDDGSSVNADQCVRAGD